MAQKLTGSFIPEYYYISKFIFFVQPFILCEAVHIFLMMQFAKCLNHISSISFNHFDSICKKMYCEWHQPMSDLYCEV